MRGAELSPVWLLRHPPVAVPRGTCYGRSEVALAGAVQDFAESLKAALPEAPLIVSSPLSRCLKLARALGECETDERLREIDFGEWEMRAFDAIERHLIDAWAESPLHFRPPGGETVAEMAARAIEALADWRRRAAGRALLIVSHGGPLRAIAGHLGRLPEAEWLALHFEPARLYPFGLDSNP